MQFTKMHGAGNDYVYVDCVNQPEPENPAELARAIADRHFGVGGDGLILICPSDVADARMRMFNADGSEAEMCGNGIRCFAKYVYDHGLRQSESLSIETGAGVLELQLEVVDGRVERVRVDMGRPELAAARIPVRLVGVTADDRVIDLAAKPHLGAVLDGKWADECGLDPRMTCVSMGNPHVVFFCRDVSRIPLAEVGPKIEHHGAFPQRINAHFVQIDGPRELTMRTWERGSGITLACGTGASAVLVAAALTGRTGREALAHLPGGDLDLAWAANDHVFMTGPAVEVFSGTWQPVAVEARR